MAITSKIKRIEKNGKKGYEVIINLGYDPKTGTYPRRYRTVWGNKPEAERVRDDLVEQLKEDRKESLSCDMTMGEWVDEWLEGEVRYKKSKSTYRAYNIVCNLHVKPTIGHLMLDDVKTEDLEELLKYKSEDGRKDGGDGGLSMASISQLCNILKSCLGSAVEKRKIKKSPADGLKGWVAKNVRPIEVLDEDELVYLLEYIKGKNSTLYHFCYLLSATGMRRGEAMALCWGDVNEKEGFVHVDKTAVLDIENKVSIQPFTKTISSNRRVYVGADVLDMLATMRNGKPSNSLIFTDEDGSPINYNWLYWHFTKCARECGFPNFTFHGLRHTHATILLRRGLNPKDVSLRLGHSNIQTTLDIYYKWIPDQDLVCAQEMGNVLKPL